MRWLLTSVPDLKLPDAAIKSVYNYSILTFQRSVALFGKKSGRLFPAFRLLEALLASPGHCSTGWYDVVRGSEIAF